MKTNNKPKPADSMQAPEEENPFSAKQRSFKQTLSEIMTQEILRRAARFLPSLSPSLPKPHIIAQPEALCAPLYAHFSDVSFVDNDAALFFLMPDFAQTPQPFTQTIWRNVNIKLADLGALLFATLAPDMRFILNEPNAPAFLPAWPTLVDLGDALMQNGFQQPALDRDVITFSYTSVAAVRADLVQEAWLINEDALTTWLAQLRPERDEYLVPINIVYGMALKKTSVASPQTILWHH